jgi:hypothetical protein
MASRPYADRSRRSVENSRSKTTPTKTTPVEDDDDHGID